MVENLPIVDFEEWCRRNPQTKDDEVKCNYCGGSGECMCDCGHEHDCAVCKGTGKVNSQLVQYHRIRQEEVDWVNRYGMTT
jgi:hypothetical protein